MAISLQDLQYLLNKQAAQAQPDAGSQAMMMAAQAARPAGAPPLPKPIDVEDGAGESPDLDKMLKEKDSELEKAKKENEKLRHDLNKSDLAHQQEMMMRDIEKKEKESLDKIKSEMEALKNEKTMHQAESVQHKAQLDKDTAMAQVKLEQQKSKALIDYNKQQVQEQIKRTDEARKEADRYKDEARKESDRMKDEARSYIDNYRSEVQKNLDAERSDMRKNLDVERATMQKSLDSERTSFEKSKAAISPALDQLMDSTLKTIHSLPVPEGQPLQLKQAYVIQDAPKFNIFNIYEEEQIIEKQANSFFDDIIEGAVISVPTTSQPVFIKCAGWWDNTWNAVADGASAASNWVVDKVQGAADYAEGKINDVRVLNYLREGSNGGLDSTGDETLDAQIQAECSKLLDIITKDITADDLEDKVKEHIMGSMFSGQGQAYTRILPSIDKIKGTNYNSYINQARQNGINLNVNSEQTDNRLDDASTTGYWLGSNVLPHLTGEKVNEQFEQAILPMRESSGVDLYDETSDIVRAAGQASPVLITNEGVPVYNRQSAFLSQEDNDKISEVWDALSLENRQAVGNVMSPYHRALVGWNAYDSEGMKSSYTSGLTNTVNNRSTQQFPTRSLNVPHTLAQYQGGFKPAPGNKYVSYQNEATNGWYDTVGGFYPMIQAGAGMFGFQLPQYPGYQALAKRTYAPINKMDIARESGELFKDVRLGRKIHSSYTPGAKALQNQQKAFN